MKGDLNDLIKYRSERANQSLYDAKILADAGHWNPCINRLYYACFYAVSALLVKDGHSSSKHIGIRSLFNQHFVKTDKVPKEMASVYNDLFERRQESDYADFVYFTEERVKPLMVSASKFVAFILEMLEQG
jgi:uncharacterized protein (UPF0332 family)